MLWLARIASPFVRLLSATTQGTLKLLRIDNSAVRAVTEEEIAASLEEGLDAGVIERHEHQMVQNVFGLDARPLPSLMIPRADIRWIDAQATVAQALDFARSHADQRAHSWYPVCRGGLDDVVGLVSLGRLLNSSAASPVTVDTLAEPATFVPETLTALELLEQFRARASRVVFVVDEYGEVQGLVTPTDLLEAITGELQPRAQVDAWATQRDDGAWVLDGLMPVAELKARLGLEALPDEERGRYNTLAGLLMAVTGRLPAVGDRVGISDWTFVVEALEGRRVGKVLALQLAASKAAS
jgi:putative hemolysin